MSTPKVSAGRPPVLNAAYKTQVYLTNSQVAALDVIGRIRNTARAALIREAVETYIASFFAHHGQKNHYESGHNSADGDAA